tara:strand:- start:45 stop:1535 length:1491 start_codon:yes stop_codon:yes gene_type:complete
MTKARDIADFKFENITDTGTEGTKVASGTTAQRGSTTGQWRFNSTTGFFEGRNATGFATLEPVPTVSSVDVTEVDSQAGGNQTFVITGTNFSSGGTITFVGSSAEFNATSTTFDSATQVTAVAPKASFLNAQEPYKIKFSSPSALSGTSADLISVDTSPTWSTAAGNIGTVTEGASANITVSATDADNDTIAYTETGGTVLSSNNLSLNSSSGVITGTAPAVSSDTTLTFNLRATANSKTADRTFNIIIADNPLQGVTEVTSLNSETNSNFLSDFDNAGGLRYITSSTDIDNVAGTTWGGTRLIKLNDGDTCGNWSSAVNGLPTSGGVSVVFWGRCSSDSTDGTPSGSINESYPRPFDFYSRTGLFIDLHASTKVHSDPFNGSNLDLDTLIGTTFNLTDWHFYAYVWSVSPSSTSSQTQKFYTNNGNTLYDYTSGSHSLSSATGKSGFMGFNPNPSGSSNNAYGFEGWTGGWRVFQSALSNAQISFLFNNQIGRFS